MGNDPVSGIGTGCWPGMKRLADYMFDKFGGRNLGCYNPRSVAGGGPSLHAEGRAQDFGFNAHDDAERADGDAMFRWAVEHAEEIGLQEMLWRGAIWYYPRKNTEFGWGDFPIAGVYGPIQQGDHESHVHLGVDKNAGMNWDPSWLSADPTPAPEIVKEQEMHLFYVEGPNSWVLWDGYNWTDDCDEAFVNALKYAGIKYGNISSTEFHNLRVVVGDHVEQQIQRIAAAVKA